MNRRQRRMVVAGFTLMAMALVACAVFAWHYKRKASAAGTKLDAYAWDKGSFCSRLSASLGNLGRTLPSLETYANSRVTTTVIRAYLFEVAYCTSEQGEDVEIQVWKIGDSLIEASRSGNQADMRRLLAEWKGFLPPQASTRSELPLQPDRCEWPREYRCRDVVRAGKPADVDAAP